MAPLLFTGTPVPRDIPLALPLPEWLLIVILIISFLAHILFVNLMVGGALLTLWCQLKGRKQSRYDMLAYEIASTITVNKSIAVVLGVAPLLSINTLYTVYFYAANALTGIMWILIIPLVTIAFLLTYLHKYSWHTLASYKSLHVTILAVASSLFLFIPMIFLVNINLMLFPEKWATVKGFLSAMILPNVFPRYLHFICASLAVTGLFVFWYFGRKRYPIEEKLPAFSRYEIQKMGYALALTASAIQFLIGPVVLVTLPAKGIGWNLLLLIGVGAAIAIPAMWGMWKAITGPEAAINRNSGKIIGAMMITIICMGSGRQVYRSNTLQPHQQLMAAKTKDFEAKSLYARENPEAETSFEIPPGMENQRGKLLFTQYCGACHKEQDVLVGPPVTEMIRIYASNTTDLKNWIRSPGKKRASMPQMPGFPQLSEDNLNEIIKFIQTTK